MLRRRLAATVAIALTMVGSCAPASPGPEKPRPISVIQLIAGPESVDDAQVIVVGFLDIETEDALLFLHKEDYDNVLLTNAIHIVFPPGSGKITQPANLKYVRIVGTFRARFHGEPALTDITACDVWSDPDHSARQQMHEQSQKALQRKP